MNEPAPDQRHASRGEEPQHLVRDRLRHHQGGAGGELQPEARQDPLRGGRERQRQERGGALDPADRAAARPHHERGDPAPRHRRPLGPQRRRRYRQARSARARGARHPRPRHLHDLPGADVEPEPGAYHRPSDRRGDPPAPPCLQGRGAGAGGGGAGAGAHSAPATEPRQLSLRILRRHAPARHDGHGAGLRAQAADRRRADHGARRHHPGRDPRADQGAAGPLRHVGDVHHP